MPAPKIQYKDEADGEATLRGEPAEAGAQHGGGGRTTARIVLDELEAAGNRRQERPTFDRLLEAHANFANGDPFQGVVAESGPTQTLPIVAVGRAPLPDVTERDLRPPAHMQQAACDAVSPDASTLTTAASIDAVVPRAWRPSMAWIAAGIATGVTIVVLSTLIARTLAEPPVAQPAPTRAVSATAVLVASSAPAVAWSAAPQASTVAPPTTAAPTTVRSAHPASSAPPVPSTRPSSGAAKPASTFQGTIVEEY